MKIAFLILSFWILHTEITISGKPRKLVSVPFEIVGSYAVIKVRINHSSPLKFILDSGVRSTLITELSHDDSLSLNYSENIFLKGLGTGERIQAFTSNNNSLQFGKMNLENQTIYVLKNDIFNLSKHIGTKVNGLMGSGFFQGHVVKIDYDNKRITVYESSTYSPPKNYTPIPMLKEDQKMFINLPIVEADGTTKQVKMLVDTGAELAAWFRAYGTNPVKLPTGKKIRGFIGQGLNGEIMGYYSRIPSIRIGKSVLHNHVVTFPDSVSIAGIFSESYRDGTIGSQILSRFNLIFDEMNNQIYFKPNSNFKSKSSYNIAGIELIQNDFVSQFSEVLYVWENSAAEKAGVQKGDLILEINEKKCFGAEINDLKSMFEVSSPKPMKMVLLRGKKTITVEVEMKSKL